MDISALNRANTDRSAVPAPTPGAGTDMFDQLLASLTEVAEPYSENDPGEDDTPQKDTDTRTDRPEAAAKRPEDLAALHQATDRILGPAELPGRTDSDAATLALTRAGTEVTDAAPEVGAIPEAATMVVDAPEAATTVAYASPAALNAQAVDRANAGKAGKAQSSQHQAGGFSDLEAATVSLRAGRNEAMQQGNGQFHTPGNNALATDKAALTSLGNEQLPAQQNQHAEQPAQSGDASRLASRQDSLVPELPKSLVPVPPAPIAAVNAPTSAVPTTNAPIEQATQLAAGTRTGTAQSVATAKQPSPSRHSAASRPQQAAQQIAVHIRNGLKAGADTIHVRLNPEELGRVEVRMQIDGDKNVQAVITVEKVEALEQLQRDSRILQRALEDAGFKSSHDSFTFEQNQSAPNQGGETPGERHIASGRGDSDLDGSDQENAAPADNRSSHDGLVDIEV